MPFCELGVFYFILCDAMISAHGQTCEIGPFWLSKHCRAPFSVMPLHVWYLVKLSWSELFTYFKELLLVSTRDRQPVLLSDSQASPLSGSLLNSLLHRQWGLLSCRETNLSSDRDTSRPVIKPLARAGQIVRHLSRPLRDTTLWWLKLSPHPSAGCMNSVSCSVLFITPL